MATKLVVDGIMGPSTIKALQRHYKTKTDGVISNQSISDKKYTKNIRGIKYGRGGSDVIRALQRDLKVKADGYLGRNTIMALQKRLKVNADGSMGPVTVKALQTYLNKYIGGGSNMAQKPIFPMKNINISQKEFGTFSHKGSTAIDITGSGSGIESAFAPCDCKVVVKSGTKVIFESLQPVQTARLGVQHIHFLMYHDNDTSDLRVGQTFKQGQKIYDEGTAGFATGNHIHMVVARGKYKREVKNAYGVWTLEGQAYSTEIFWIKNDNRLFNLLGNKYQKMEDASGITGGSTLKTGDIKDIWKFYDKFGNTRYIRSDEHKKLAWTQTSPVSNRYRFFTVQLNPKAKFFETKHLTNLPQNVNQSSGIVDCEHSHQVKFNGKGWDVL